MVVVRSDLDPAFLGELDCVSYQVDQDLLEPASVTLADRQGDRLVALEYLLGQRTWVVILDQQISMASFKCRINVPRDGKTPEVCLRFEYADQVIKCLVRVKSFAD